MNELRTCGHGFNGIGSSCEQVGHSTADSLAQPPPLGTLEMPFSLRADALPLDTRVYCRKICQRTIRRLDRARSTQSSGLSFTDPCTGLCIGGQYEEHTWLSLRASLERETHSAADEYESVIRTIRLTPADCQV